MESLLILGGLAALGVPFILSLVCFKRLDAIAAELGKLTRRVTALEATEPMAAATPAIPRTTKPPPLPPIPILPPRPPPSPTAKLTEPASLPAQTPPVAAAPSWFETIDWEAFMGVKLFAWLGGFVLFLGVVFLVKYSFERNLVTPAMRVVLGSVIGLALLVAGWWTAARQYRVSGQSLCATGVLILYANIFAAHAFYHLIALVPAFVLMAIITLGAFVLAVRLDAQVVAVLGLAGGFITPVLISAGDNAAALFTYIALLNAGIAALAIHRRWDYLVLLAAVGTVATEFGWAFLRIGHPAAPLAFVVFIGFQLQFFAFFVRALRSAAQSRWFVWSATAVGFAAIAWGFCFLDYGDIRHQPPFLFSYVFLADAALLALAFLNDRDSRLAGFAGSAVFAFLATWTANYLTERNLWWALGAFVLFALLHAIFAVWLREASTRPKNAWIAESVPLLPLALICLCVVQGNTSFAIWFCVLVLDVVLITLAIVRSSTRTMILALIATLAAAALWIVAAPRAEDVLAFLVVTGGFGFFFFSAALFAARRFAGHNVELRRNLPALAAGLPFFLLIMAVAKLPILNPTPVFTVAFLLAVLLLG
ncbi:MAG: DUF2339 domain-containing protein, partial [Chthoniobacterales bacterium]|nr:DUF2339 domain-containing protein [Chthoniobacterales bacterium]